MLHHPRTSDPHHLRYPEYRPDYVRTVLSQPFLLRRKLPFSSLEKVRMRLFLF